MLVLTRKKDESIIIKHNDQEIVIVVQKVNGVRASIGVIAGPDVKIVRAELDGQRKA